MSIKIYDGLIIERELSLAQLRSMAAKARARFDELVERSLTEAAARAAASAHDQALLGRRDPKKEGSGEELSPWRSALSVGGRSIDEQREADKRGERVWLPLSFEAALMPIGPGKILALGFGTQELQEEFVKAFKARPYGYWDNTDPPEDVDARAWSQRKRDWQKALGAKWQWSPAEAGLTAQLTSSKYKSWWQPEAEQAGEALRADAFSPRARAFKLACDELVNFIMVERESEFKGKELSAFVHVHGDAREWLASEEGQDQARRLAEKIEPLLPVLTLDRVKKPLQEVVAEGDALRLALKEAQVLRQACQTEPAPKAKARL